MKNIKSKLCLISLTGMLAAGLVACDSAESGADVGASKKVGSQNISEVYVKTDGQNIEFHSTNESEIKVDSGKIKNPKIKEEGNKLEIDAGESSAGINFKTATMHIYVPKKTYDKIEATTVSGKVTAEDISAKQLKLSNDSGDTTLENYKGENITSTSKSGVITFKGIESDFDIQNNTGDVNVSMVKDLKNEGKIKTESGSVDISFTKEPKGLAVDFSTRAGKIKNEYPLSSGEKGNDNKVKGNIGSEKSDGAKLIVESSTGTINLKSGE
ncbi:DUF4097 family beta strand repeat-containing protein [Paenibacillus sp. 102]|uniref:DUF4097 family beta strand repeat-containing protein n=1 Tax=Paenibacillus sp. 102 TaxID=3120823 RepID=UPI0031BADBE6